MNRSTAIRTFFLLGLTFACAAFAADPPPKKNCVLTQYAALDLQMGEEVYVPIKLNDQPGYMSLDLGSAISIINKATVESLKLSTRELPTEVYINKSKARNFAEYKSLALGAVRFGKGSFLADPRDKEAGVVNGQPLFGSIGTDALGAVDFELDLAHRKLNLFSPDRCPGNPVYWSDTVASAPLYRGDLGTMYFPIELESKKVEATFAPSNRTTRLSTDVTKKLYGFDKTSTGIETKPSEDAEGDGGSVSHYRAMHLTAPGLSVTDTPIRLSDPNRIGGCYLETRGRKGGGAGYSGCYNVYPMSLGQNILSKMRLYFAMKEHMLYFTAADAGFSALVEPAKNP
jgi:hypothetical protein